jgi:Na+-translocating ferredoxin:NAD+ oxidoreductase RNF subunit RnfB
VFCPPGKEKVFERIADVLDCKIYAAPDKRRILNLLENVNISSRLVDRPLDARVHVVNMQQLRHDVSALRGFTFSVA